MFNIAHESSDFHVRKWPTRNKFNTAGHRDDLSLKLLRNVSSDTPQNKLLRVLIDQRIENRPHSYGSTSTNSLSNTSVDDNVDNDYFGAVGVADIDNDS